MDVHVGIVLLLSWLGLFAFLLLTGYGVARLVFNKDEWPLDLFHYAWIGLATLLCLTEFWSLFAPINKQFVSLTLLLAAAGGVSAWTSRRRQTPIRQEPLRFGWLRLPLFFIALALVAWAATAASAQREIVHYDTPLYHWNAVRWAKEHAIPPGLANLHIRLGTNTAWLLLAAWVDHGPLGDRTAWVMPGFACVLFSAYLLHVLLISRQASFAMRSAALLLLPYAIQQLAVLGPGLGFDAPAQVILVAAFLELLRDCGGTHPSSRSLKIATITAAVSFVIKPIGAPATLAIGLLALGYWIRNLYARNKRWVTGFKELSLPALLLMGWMARNALLSGYLLFPAPIMKLPVDWAVAVDAPGGSHTDLIQSARGLKSIIQAWARRPGPRYLEAVNAPLHEWVPAWYEANKQNIEVHRLPPVGALALLLMYGIAIKRRRLHWNELTLPLVAIACLLFWFHSAPDIRFGGGLFWLFYAVCVALLLAALSQRIGLRTRWVIAIVVALFLSWNFAAQCANRISNSPWKWGRAASAKITLVQVNAQTPPLLVYIPIAGDQVGDAPLPATPYPSKRLMARVPGKWWLGFRRD